MLEHVERAFPHESFVKKLEKGFIIHDPDLIYCRISFDLSNFTDKCYELEQIVLPAHLLRAPRKRKGEYLAGRICCQAALKSLGIHESVLSGYPEREPLWPAKVRGSISHSGEKAIAVISPFANKYVGIDIELLTSSELLQSKSMFSSAEEIERVESQTDAETGLALIFSAKEAFFKALYPVIKIYFGFECASVDVISECEFTLTLTCTLTSDYRKGHSFSGFFYKDTEAKSILTFITILHP